MERTIVNSIKRCDKDEDVEVKECVKQLEASKQEIELVKIEDLLGENIKGSPLVIKEGEKD